MRRWLIGLAVLAGLGWALRDVIFDAWVQANQDYDADRFRGESQQAEVDAAVEQVKLRWRR